MNILISGIAQYRVFLIASIAIGAIGLSEKTLWNNLIVLAIVSCVHRIPQILIIV